jgi:hypothetical protein
MGGKLENEVSGEKKEAWMPRSCDPFHTAAFTHGPEKPFFSPRQIQ